MGRKDSRIASSLKRRRADESPPDSKQSVNKQSQTRKVSESSESSNSDEIAFKNFFKANSFLKAEQKAFCFAEDTSNSSDEVPLSKLVSSVQETDRSTSSGGKLHTIYLEEAKKRIMGSNKDSEDSSDTMPLPASNADEDSKLDDMQQQSDESQTSSCDSSSTDEIFKTTMEKDVSRNKKRKREVSSGEDSCEESPPKSKHIKIEGNPKESVATKGKRPKKRVDSSSSSDEDIFPEKSGGKFESATQINSEMDSIDGEKKSTQLKTDKSNCSDSSENSSDEVGHCSEVKPKPKAKSSQLKKKKAVSPKPSTKPSTKQSKSANKKIKTGDKEHSPKAIVDEKPAGVKTRKAIESSSSSSSDGESDNGSSESSASENEKSTKITGKKKRNDKKTPQKKKKLNDHSSENKIGKKEDTVKAQSEALISSSESSVGSDDDDKENVGESLEVSKEKQEEKNVTAASSDNSSDSEEENQSKKGKKIKEKTNGSGKQSSDAKKKKPGDNPRIARLQRYLKEAGIRVQNYKTLWEGCKSDKARAAKLLELLEEHGLKGKPTLSECKKLRKKLETEKEIAELNTANIIQTCGRPRRNAQSLYATPFKDAEEPASTPKKSPEFKKAFSRLKAIVDSEDSD